MTTEEKKPTMMEEIQGAGQKHLAKVVPINEDRIDLLNPLKWSREDIDTIKNTVCPKGIPDNEFKLFILKCQASGMNPLLGEAFCIERNIKIGGTRDNPVWGKTFQFTPGEQGMEGRADDFADYRGIRAAAVYENDKIIIDSSAGEVSHQWNPVDPKRGRLVGAWAIAYRDGRKTPVEYVRLEEYIDTRNPKWASSPATMIVKCARAAALRRAYPNKFDGIFVREEMRDESEDQQTPKQAEQAGRDTTDKLAERLAETAKKQTELQGGGTGASSSKASGATIDVVPNQPKKTPPDLKVVSGQAGPAQTTVDPAVAEAKRIMAAQEALKLPAYDGQKLLEDKAYREAAAAEVDKAAKRAAGAISEGSMEGAAKAGPAPVDEGPKMTFGDFKGKTIKSLEGPQLVAMLELGNAKLSGLDDRKKKIVLETIGHIKDEIATREKALIDDVDDGQQKSREPGEEG